MNRPEPKNVEYHCGRHRDDDYPEYGDTHFQYDHPGIEAPVYEATSFVLSARARYTAHLLQFGSRLSTTARIDIMRTTSYMNHAHAW